MKFQPKSEKELSEEKLLPAGEYGFEISRAEEKTSKQGNEMIELLVRVYKPDGNFFLVNDYLMEKMAFKLRHAAEACGLLHEYEGGILQAESFVGKTGRLKLKIQADKTGQYPDKNVIADYIVEKDGKTSFVPKKSDPFVDKKKDDVEDEIPW